MHVHIYIYIYTSIYIDITVHVHIYIRKDSHVIVYVSLYTTMYVHMVPLNFKNLPSQAHRMGRCIHGGDLKLWIFEACLKRLRGSKP